MTADPFPTVTVGQLEQGRMYRFTYRYQAGNYRWYERQTIAQFLALNERGWSAGGGQEIVISLRPLLGTSTLNPAEIVAVELLPDDAAPISHTKWAAYKPGLNGRTAR